jgi:hypothetical protein
MQLSPAFEHPAIADISATRPATVHLEREPHTPPDQKEVIP